MTVAVIGSTASGKSSVALAAAQARPDIELVSVDSMQVYRGMDIGTAKPTVSEQAGVPHHLIDIVEADHEFTVAEFQLAFRAVVADLQRRERRPLLVGGTGLYHRAVIDDLELPGEWPSIRDRLRAEISELGPERMHQRLTEVDPDAASKIEPSNERRIVRALEVCEGSGRAFSSFGPGLDAYPPSSVTQIGLRWDRAVLTDRIEGRVQQMISDGLVEEVERTRSTTGFSRTARQALGYKEILDHLDGECSLAEAVDKITRRTRQFAVRQERWFRRDPRILWVEIQSDPVAEALPTVLATLDTDNI